MGLESLPEGFRRDKRGRLYNAGARRFASRADAEAIGVPFRLESKTSPRDVPVADFSFDPATAPNAKNPKRPRAHDPQDEDESRPAKPKITTKAKDDENDLKELVGQVYFGLGAITGFPGWRIAEDEAEKVARPAQRLLARNKALDRTVRQYSDPIALVLAVLSVTLVRYMMWREWLAAGAPALAAAPPPQPPPPPHAPPPPAASNGVAANVDEVLARLRDAAG